MCDINDKSVHDGKLKIPGGETKEEWLAELEFFHLAKDRIEEADALACGSCYYESDEDDE